MSRGGAVGEWRHCNRQGRSHLLFETRRLLQRGLPHGGAWLERQSETEVLMSMTREAGTSQRPPAEPRHSRDGDQASRFVGCVLRIVGCAIAHAIALTGFAAADVDLGKLPPPASRPVEYDRDVKPIL